MTGQGDGVHWTGPRGVITMPAEIDATNAGEIREALVSAVGGDVAVLIIDMSATTFCDSAGIQAIVDARNRAVTTGTQVRLAATDTLRILKLVGVDQIIPVYPTLEAALAGDPAT